MVTDLKLKFYSSYDDYLADAPKHTMTGPLSATVSRTEDLISSLDLELANDEVADPETGEYTGTVLGDYLALGDIVVASLLYDTTEELCFGGFIKNITPEEGKLRVRCAGWADLLQGYTITESLQDEDIGEVLKRWIGLYSGIIDTSGLGPVQHRVSTQFEEVALTDAIKTLLEPTGYVLVIHADRRAELIEVARFCSLMDYFSSAFSSLGFTWFRPHGYVLDTAVGEIRLEQEIDYTFGKGAKHSLVGTCFKKDALWDAVAVVRFMLAPYEIAWLNWQSQLVQQCFFEFFARSNTPIITGVVFSILVRTDNLFALGQVLSNLCRTDNLFESSLVISNISRTDNLLKNEVELSTVNRTDSLFGQEVSG